MGVPFVGERAYSAGIQLGYYYSIAIANGCSKIKYDWSLPKTAINNKKQNQTSEFWNLEYRFHSFKFSSKLWRIVADGVDDKFEFLPP